ncbi:MAG: response regulator transcription factor [Blastocatellia bacterium]|jgi:two-component system KDP operon response regulator KdpE|nr:response regulator transcription factor [Blastocatellia bacterium]MBK6424805.1 response regulator transcription factor [Blastocatellia bacterium]
MERRRRILVVDDEPQITRVLRVGLNGRGFDVRTAADAESALDTLADWTPDLVVTDLTMPGTDGIELCRRIRKRSQIPIIVLSVKNDERTKVAALDEGADDYVTKPFSMDELLARIRAALRRMPAAEGASEGVLEVGDFRVDFDAHAVSVRGEAVRLTPKEFELLAYLVRHAGKVLTHRTLLTAIWGANYSEQVEYLRVFVGHIRKKIEVEPSSPRYLVTEPWTGYRFDPGGE